MNQRLVWNFEFSAQKTTFAPAQLTKQDTEQLKWEIRFFWPDDEIIILHNIDPELLDLTNYNLKCREDYYYVLPDNNCNIKKRRDELLYKPLLKQANNALGFGAKINIHNRQDLSLPTAVTESFLQELTQKISAQGIEIFVKKEAFIFKFSTIPTIKLELARLKVLNQVYLSACIEGKSLILVESIAKHLLGKRNSCEYVAFLKKIIQP